MATKRGTSKSETIIGTAGADSLFGLGGNDKLKGGNGNDKLDGGTGKDKMSGGAGNDSYIVDNTGDRVSESANQGTDTVKSSVSFTLGSNVERLTLTGSATTSGVGNSLDNVITGHNGTNILLGLNGNDVLIGGGGTDDMEGGNGNDTLIPGAGNGQQDFINGGADFDTVDYRDAQGGVQVWLELNVLSGHAQNDVVSTVESVAGSQFSDSLMASSISFSNAFGGAGNDRILGSSAVYDRLRGDDGNDELVGATGEEDFWLQYDRGMDFVINFRLSGEDHIFLVGSEFNLGTNPGNFISSAEFATGDTQGVPEASNFSGIVKLFYDTSSEILWADRDGGAGPGAPVAIALFDENSGGPVVDIFRNDIFIV